MKQVEEHTHLIELSNGLKLLHIQQDHLASGHLAMVAQVGTRDEKEGEMGMAHFLEHMFFKGTNKRKAFHVINRIESIGGDLSAYTTKEFTCLYAGFLNDYAGRAIELMSDIVLNPSFPQKEISKEIEVVLDEINAYQDDYAESIYDDFESQLFLDHPLGNYILGTKESVRSFSQEAVRSFYLRNYTANNLIFVYIGGSNVKKIQALFTRHFEAPHTRPPATDRLRFEPMVPGFQSKVHKPSVQAYCCIGCRSMDIYDDRRYTMHLLNNVLCGDNMNSRLNMKIRENKGLVYSIASDYLPYSDSGVFAIQFSTEPKKYERVLKEVNKSLDELRSRPLGTVQFRQARQQLVNRLKMSADSPAARMLSAGKSFLDYGRMSSLGENIKKIEELGPHDIQNLALALFDEDKISTLKYMPK